MKFLEENGFNIFIVGRWNPSIFSPQWIRANLVSGNDEVMIAIPFGNPLAPPRMSFAGIQLFTANDFLELKPDSLDSDNIKSCADVASKILSLLCHTPITAIGVNVRFEEQAPCSTLDKIFSFSDQALIDQKAYPTTSSTVARSFSLGQQDSLNLSITQNSTNYVVEFNFHTESQDKGVVISKADESYVTGRISKAKQFMLSAYSLTIDE